MLLIATLLAAIVAVSADSSSECIPTVTTVPIPSTIVSILSDASYYYPSVYTMGSLISTLELSSPSIATAETVIEYYVPSYDSIVDELESMYSYPSLYTDLSYDSEFTSAYPTLATAVSAIESAELTQTAIADYQSSLQSLETSYTTILTDLTLYTGFAYPSVYTASYIISEATLTDSSIFATVIAVSTAVSVSPSVSSAMSSLSSFVYTLPSTVVTQIVTLISSPSTVGSSTISSLESCYSTVLSDISVITSFTYNYPSIVTAITSYLYAASQVSSLGSAVSTIVTEQMPTLSYEVSVLTAAATTQPSITVDLSVLTGIIAESPTIGTAESTIEATFYNSPSIASTIYNAIVSPSVVTNPSAVSLYEESHESFVSAVTEITNWESYYASSASMMTQIETQLTTAFVNYGTLLTAYNYVEDVTSPSEAAATASFSVVKSSVYDLTYIMSGLVSIISYLPSFSCYESTIEYYAEEYPYVASYMWSVYDDEVYVASSSMSSFASLTASYPTLAYEEYQILGGMIDYSFLGSLESSFIYAAESDSSLLTQYEQISSYSMSAVSSWTTEMCVSSSS